MRLFRALTAGLLVALCRWWDPVGYTARHLSVGAWGEWWAARYLRKRGYRILESSWRDSQGELDLIAWDQRQGRLVIVEVKSRRVSQELPGGLAATWAALETAAGEAVDLVKQGRITRAALRYKRRYGLLECPTRFDVLTVVAVADGRPRIKHWLAAFDAVDDHGSMY